MNVAYRTAMSWLAFGVFLYTLITSAFLQLYLMPAWFPELISAEGLVNPDSIGFHQMALEQVEIMRVDGWSAWELRPKWQAISGIASAIYMVTSPSPVAMLPFNAFVQMLSVCVIFALLTQFFSKRAALAGAVLYALNPGALEWTAQMHKDGVFILGNLMYIWALVRLFPKWGAVYGDHGWIRLATWGGVAILGTVLVWVARPYWVYLMLPMSALTLIIKFGEHGYYLWRATGKKIYFSESMAILVVCAFQIWMIQSHLHYGYEGAPSVVESAISDNNRLEWKRSDHVPGTVDMLFYQIANSRHSAIRMGGGSLIDADWPLDSVERVLMYLPRGVQVGLFSPFPDLWRGEGRTGYTTLARKIMGGVTAVFYVCLVGFFVGFYYFKDRIGYWIMLLACAEGIVAYAISTPNVGTLLRYRYGFYMLMVSFGAACLFEARFRTR